MEVDYTAINFRDKQFCNASSAQHDRKIAMVLSSAEQTTRWEKWKIAAPFGKL